MAADKAEQLIALIGARGSGKSCVGQSLARKLGIFRDTYAMLNDEAQTARGNVLEVIIILLIVIEVVMGLIRN